MPNGNVVLKKELGLIGATSIVIGSIIGRFMSFDIHSIIGRLMSFVILSIIGRFMSFDIYSIIGSGIFISPKGVLVATGSVGLCMIVWAIAGIIALGDIVMFFQQYTFITVPGSLVIQSLTFARYLVPLLPTCGTPVQLEKIVAATGLFTLYLVNCSGTRYSAHVSVVTTFCKLLALAVIVVTGLVAIAQE
ncbi:Y+L amino acid transporter 2-like [Physella acuta]|uniref:Y+L amino acid transporter 2-like n=1 Tax=Physella acuta TaxID=109671 RepID=UPI0027DDF8DA|nr:Y+L amino acid transporter 2-like [Physella acuta]